MSGATAFLEVHELRFGYRRGADPVIDGFSDTFADGAITAVTGASGSGKSTLLYILGLMLRPQTGSLRWGGADALGRSDAERARMRATNAGFVFQDAMLDPSRSVLDNVLEGALYAGIPSGQARERAVALCQRFGVGHRLQHRPGEVSGGQAQRVALCRALVKVPRVIFGDEPTGNLDDESAQVVFRAMRECAAAGATVIIATHDHELADRADERIDLP